jgi:hypothetical protein
MKAGSFLVISLFRHKFPFEQQPSSRIAIADTVRTQGVGGRSGATATPGRSDKVDTDEADEVIVAIAKTVAELTCRQDGMIRHRLIEQLMREIMNYDAEIRRDDPTGVSSSQVQH